LFSVFEDRVGDGRRRNKKNPVRRDSKRNLNVCFVCLLFSVPSGREAVTPEGFRFSPMLGVIAVGCVASVASVACVVAAAVAMQRKRSRRRRRRRARSADGSKTAVDGDGTGGGTADNGARTADAVGGADGGAGDGTPAGGVGAGGGTDRYYHADAADDGLDKNPDIIPHDNGKSAAPSGARVVVARRFSSRNIPVAVIRCGLFGDS